MKFRRYTLLSLLAGALTLGGALVGGGAELQAQALLPAQQRVATYKNGIRQGQILVKFKANEEVLSEVKRAVAVSALARTRGVGREAISLQSLPRVSKIADQIHAVEIMPLFEMNPKFEKRFKKEGLDRWFVIEFESDDNPIAVMEALKASNEVQSVDLTSEIVHPYQYRTRPIYVPSVLALNSTGITNDPMFNQQWHYHNTGQTGGTPGADINLVKAWERRMNAEDIVVAVMDQGVDHQHEDIRANMWVNEKELFGTPGVDDDGNGLIDDIYGFDFGNGYASIEKGEHGTHVAGTVAAVTNNGVGVSGIAGGDGSGNGARIMTLPVFGQNNTRAVNSFIYAADMGALISQNSWGFSTPGYESDAWREAINYFIKYAGCDADGNRLPGVKMKGGVVLFAAGNNAESGRYFPGCMDEVIGVSALNHINKPAFYSNFDTWVDVACYGGETDPRKEQGVLSTLPNNQYGFMDGTSMACPHVAGIAALALAELGGEGFTNEMLWNYLTLTTRGNSQNYESKYQGRMGVGIVDALNAMTRNDGVPPNKIESVLGTTFADTYFRIMFTAPSKEDGAKVEGYKVVATNVATQEKRNYSFNTAQQPGEQEILLLTGLSPETTYDVSLTSFDIWLTESPASDPIRVTTAKVKGTLGATQTLFTREMNFDDQQMLSYDVTIRNSGTGALHWRADAYSRAHAKSYELFSLENALNGLRRSNIAIYADAETEASQIYKDFGFKKWISYRKASYPIRYIGEVREKGVTKPSSAAVKFDVPAAYTEGFTLTHFEVGIRTDAFWLYDDQLALDKQLPVDFEIYRGGDQPRAENRIYRSTLVRTNEDLLDIYELPYRPRFDAGEHFWIVVHADKGFQYPLGVTEDATEVGHSFYSSNGGATWESTDKLFPGTFTTFTIGALSKFDLAKPDMSLEPASGYLNAGETRTFRVSIDATNIPEGTDSTNIVLSTDGSLVSGRSVISSVLNLRRSDIASSFGQEFYDYSTVSLGDSKDLKVMIKNRGKAHWPIDSIVLSNRVNFSLVQEKPQVLYAGDSLQVAVRFTTTQLGAANTQVKFYGRNRVDSVLLIGTCVEAPTAVITPLESSLSIKGNNKVTHNLTIRNSSNYSLSYSFPEFVDRVYPKPDFSKWDEDDITEDMIYADSTDLYAGYQWVDNYRGSNYAGSPFVDISQTGVELTNKVDYVQKNTKVRLPFAFPYYDRQVRELFVGVNGTLVVDSADFGKFNVPVILPDYMGEQNEVSYKGVIAPLWMSDGTGANFSKTRFFYQVLEDCIIFQFEGTIVATIESSKPSIYQVALYPNGAMEFRYKQVFDTPSWTSNSFMVGWGSPDGLDGATIWYLTNHFSTIANRGDYAIRITPPSLMPFEKAPSVAYKGIVNPMASKNFSVVIDPSKLPAGKSMRELMIETNDPANKAVAVAFNFDKEDEPSFEFTHNSVDYGQLLFPAAIEKEIQLFNSAQSTQGVKLSLEGGNNVTFANGAREISLEVKANSTVKFLVYLNGAVDAKIVATSTTGSTRFDEMAIRSQVAAYDNFRLNLFDKQSLSFDLAAGTSQSEVIRVTADANSYRSKLFLPGFMSAEELPTTKTVGAGSATRIDGNGYRWYNSNNPEAPQFIWNDISKTGTRLPLEPHLDNPVIKLPFSYNFYDVTSDVLYVSPAGRISYLPLPWDVFDNYTSARRMPNSDLEFPFISAMWGRQWYTSTNADAGIFYDVNEERCIIQFNLFQFDWVVTKGFTSYQIIVQKDGTFQFVYLDLDKCDLKDHVTIGMQGEGGSATKGFTYSLTSSTPISGRTTITAKPMYGPYTVEAGKSVDLKLTANSYGFKAGSYNDEIIFVSENDQLQSKLPVSLSVSSNAHLLLKENEVNFGDVIVGDEVEPMIFTLMNSGNEDLILSAINYSEGAEKLFTVKKKELVLDSDFGEFTEEFIEVTFPLSLPVYGSESFYLFFTPEDADRSYDVQMNFVTTNGDSNEPLKLKARSLKPAKVAILSPTGATSMKVDLFNTTGAIYDNVKVSHKEGEGSVDYSLGYEVVNPLLEPLALMSTPGAAVRYSANAQPVFLHHTPFAEGVAASVQPMPMSSESISAYRNVSVIGDVSPESMIGTADLGAHYGLSAFVKMTTGESGFLMSHLKMWTNTIGRDTGYVEVRIYENCKEPSREHLLYEKAHRYKMNVSLVGELTLPLEHDIAFAPNQEFWVEVYFGIKLEMPMAVATRPSDMEGGRNFYRLFNAKKGEWETFREFPNTLFAIWAVQESYSDLTRWLTVSDEERVIAPNQTEEVAVRMNRLHIPMGGSSVRVKANTKQLTNVEPLNLEVTKYQEPIWSDLPTKTLLVHEGSEVSFFAKAVEAEGLPIEYSLKSAVEGVKLTPENGGVRITYKAPYTAGFVANLNIEARTTKGVSVRRVSIGNIDVNRPPVAGDIKPINISLDPMNTSVVFSPYFFFVDPDGDALQYGGSVNGSNISLNLNQNGFIFTPIQEGQCDVVLVAYDAEFEVTNKFIVNVIRPLVYAPVLTTPIGNRSATTGEGFTVDLSNHFTDIGGYELSYEAWSTDNKIGVASVSGSTVSVLTLNPGIAAVGVRVRNSEGGETTSSFAFRALGEAKQEGATEVKSTLSISPNPSRSLSVVSFSTEHLEAGDYFFEVRDLAGKRLRVERLNAMSDGDYVASLNVAGIQSGVYILTVYKDGVLVATEKLVVAE